MIHGLLAAIEERRRPTLPSARLVDLEGILGHQADGAGDAARAFLLLLDDRRRGEPALEWASAHYGPLQEGNRKSASGGPNPARRHVFWSGDQTGTARGASCLKPPSST